MFFNILDNLRSLPPERRRQIALAVTVIFTIAIAVFWVVNLKAKLENNAEAERRTETENPFAVLKESFSTFGESFKDIKENFGALATSSVEVNTEAGSIE